MASATLMEVHETASHRLTEIADSSSVPHIWLVKQAEHVLLKVRSEFPGTTVQLRLETIDGLRRVIEHALNRDSQLTDSSLHQIGSIIATHAMKSSDSLRAFVAFLAHDILAETGFDILSFEGLMNPPELQNALGRVMRLLVRHIGKHTYYQIHILVRQDSATLTAYAEALEAVLNRYEDSLSDFGFDIQLGVPSLGKFLCMFESPSENFIATIGTLQDQTMRELDGFSEQVVSWARLLTHPRLIARAHALDSYVYMNFVRKVFPTSLAECLHESGSKRERTCSEMNRLKLFLTNFVRSDWHESVLRLALSGSFRWTNPGGGDQVSDIPTFDDVGVLANFPVDSPVLVRIKSSLNILVHHENLGDALANVRRGFIEAILHSVDDLNPSQLSWLDNFLREGIYVGIFSVGSALESASVMAYELLRVCRIRLFDFLEESAVPGVSKMRSIVSNLIVTGASVWDFDFFAVIAFIESPEITDREKELYVDAWKTFTVAHKAYEGVGRERTISGFLLDSFRGNPRQFLQLLTEHKMALHSPNRLLMSKLPAALHDLLGKFASPIERLTPLVHQIDHVYRRHAQRVADSLETIGRGNDASRLLTSFKRLSAAIFRQLILARIFDTFVFQQIPDIYLMAASQFVELLERFPDDLSQRTDRLSILEGLETAYRIVNLIERKPYKLVYDTEGLEAALLTLRNS